MQFNKLTWVNIEHPTRAEMSYLKDTYNFHPLALDDCLSRIQLPKVDEYEDHVFLVLHFPLFNKMLRITQPSQVAIFAGASYIVTVHRGDLRPLSKLFSDCRASEAIRGEIMGRSSGYLLYRILDVLVDYCFPVLNKIIDNMDAVEADMAAQDHEDLVHELAVVRRDVVAFRRIVRPQVEVMETLETKEYAVLRVDPDVYFGDLADHTRRIWEELEALKEASDELSDTMVAINQTLSNNAIRFLTVFFTVTLPVTMVGSLYGMNVPLPFQGHWWSFWALLGISILPTFGMLYLFRRRGWL